MRLEEVNSEARIDKTLQEVVKGIQYWGDPYNVPEMHLFRNA